jgi:hypothetical protein
MVEFVRDLFADELAEGEAKAEAQGSRRLLLRLLQERFGELPHTVVEHFEKAGPSECEELGVRLLQASSLEELGLMATGNGRTGSIS